MPSRPGSKKMNRAKWEKWISWKKPSKNLFTLSNNLRFQVSKRLLVDQWANMKLEVVKAIEDKAKKDLLLVDSNCQHLLKDLNNMEETTLKQEQP